VYMNGATLAGALAARFTDEIMHQRLLEGENLPLTREGDSVGFLLRKVGRSKEGFINQEISALSRRPWIDCGLAPKSETNG